MELKKIAPVELKDTVSMMLSEDYKERFKAEYYQIRIRLDKLDAMLEKWKAGTLEFKPKNPRPLLEKQAREMWDYLYVLEVRAENEGIEL